MFKPGDKVIYHSNNIQVEEFKSYLNRVLTVKSYYKDSTRGSVVYYLKETASNHVFYEKHLKRAGKLARILYV